MIPKQHVRLARVPMRECAWPLATHSESSELARSTIYQRTDHLRVDVRTIWIEHEKEIQSLFLKRSQRSCRFCGRVWAGTHFFWGEPVSEDRWLNGNPNKLQGSWDTVEVNMVHLLALTLHFRYFPREHCHRLWYETENIALSPRTADASHAKRAERATSPRLLDAETHCESRNDDWFTQLLTDENFQHKRYRAVFDLQRFECMEMVQFSNAENTHSQEQFSSL